MIHANERQRVRRPSGPLSRRWRFGAATAVLAEAEGGPARPIVRVEADGAKPPGPI